MKDRRLLMNQLKLQLRKMNKENRHSAMVELKKSFSKENNGKKLHKNQKTLMNDNVYINQNIDIFAIAEVKVMVKVKEAMEMDISEDF